MSPRRYRVVTTEIAAEIVRLYREGVALVEIAALMDMSRGHVDKVLDREGVERNRRRTLTDEQRAEVVCRYRAGESQGSLAEAFHVSQKAIHNALVAGRVDKRT